MRSEVEFEDLSSKVKDGYFTVRAPKQNRDRARRDFNQRVHDSRGRFLLAISRQRIVGWIRVGWLEAIQEDAARGREYLVTDAGRRAAQGPK